MPINWGQLQPVPMPGGVVGNIPSGPQGGVRPNDDFGSILGGLAGGLKDMQAQRMQQERMNMAKQAQAASMQNAQARLGMDREAHGAQMQEYEQKQEALQQQQMTAEDMRQRSMESDAMYKEGLLQDPSGKGRELLTDYQMKQAKLEELGNVAEYKEEETSSKKMDNYIQRSSIMASIASSALATPDEMKDQVWQQLLPHAKQAGIPMPDQYDQNFTFAMMQKSMADMAKYKEMEEAKRAPTDLTTTNQKDLRRESQLMGLPEEESKNHELRGLQSNRSNLMRDELNKLSKPFIDVSDAYGRIQTSAKDPSAAGDLALIFNYMKMLDPGSTVREGEFATAQNSGSVPERIRAMYNKTTSGERLTNVMRNDFVTRAHGLYKSQEKSYQRNIDDYGDRAKRAGLDPKDVVVDARVKDREQGGMVTIKLPDGRTGQIPHSNLKKATALGAKQVD